METYIILLVAILLLMFAVLQNKKRAVAAIVNHRLNHKRGEIEKMKELAERFIGKECLVYTVSGGSEMVKGTVTEVTDGGVLIENNGSIEVVNLEYITRIREWPRSSKGKKKAVFS